MEGQEKGSSLKWRKENDVIMMKPQSRTPTQWLCHENKALKGSPELCCCREHAAGTVWLSLLATFKVAMTNVCESFTESKHWYFMLFKLRRHPPAPCPLHFLNYMPHESNFIGTRQMFPLTTSRLKSMLEILAVRLWRQSSAHTFNSMHEKRVHSKCTVTATASK